MSDPFEALRRTYRERLVLQVEALKGVREGLGSPETREGSTRSARRLAHRLRGSGATLGFPAISDAAARVEDCDESMLIVEIDSLLDEVRRAIRDQTGARARGAALVIDDDPSVIGLLRLSLAPYADQVICGGSIAEAKALLESHSVAIIVIDLGLPDGDARDLISLIGGDPTLSRVPVVVLSGSVDDQVRQECLALGATEVHLKPVDPVALAASVRALLGYEGSTMHDRTGDEATGLPGPGSLFQAGLAARRQNARSGENWAVGFLRCPVQEELLREVADILRRSLPHGSTIVRWSRNSFGVLCVPCTGEQLERRIMKLLPACRRAADRLAVSGDLSGGVMEAASSHPNNVFKMSRRMVELAAMAGGDQVVASVVGEDRRRGRVLLAEDDPTVAEAITLVLDKELDLEVHHVPDGADAIALARDAAFDLFVLDIEMPGADGLTVLRYLRSERRYRRTPVVMVTALDGDRQMVEGLETGANDYITKPFSPVVLAARLKRLM